MIGFVIFLILLFTQTFVVNSGSNIIQIIPFNIILEQSKGIWTKNDGLNEFIFNIVGNIGIFVPIGIIRHNLLRVTLNGFIISLFIETVQLPLNRTTDIDDIILNTAGTVIGYFLYRIVPKNIYE